MPGPYTAGIMPTFGVTVPPGDAMNTTDALIKNGLQPTFFADGCRFYVEAASVNGLISEILNAVNCAGLEYDPDRLDNLCLAIQAIVETNKDTAEETVTKLCGDPEAIAALAACIISTQAGNTITVGADGKLFVAAIDSPEAPAIDVWSLRVGVGQIYMVDTSLGGVEIPPSAIPAVGPVFIQLTAGLGIGANFNAGKITAEMVDPGTGPRPFAYCNIALTSSPMFGQTVRLLNTEHRMLRPSLNPGSLQEDQFQGHFHEAGAGGEGIGLSTYVNDLTDAWTFQPYPEELPGSGNPRDQVLVGSGAPGAPSNMTAMTDVRYGNETRGRNLGVTAYMRIR